MGSKTVYQREIIKVCHKSETEVKEYNKDRQGGRGSNKALMRREGGGKGMIGQDKWEG